MSINNYYTFALICILLAGIVCLNAKWFSERFNLLDIPSGRKQHSEATPLLGGVTILIAFVPVAVFELWNSTSDRWTPTLLIWLTCICVMTLVGIADDRHSLSPRARLIISFLVFCSAAAIDPSFNVRILDFHMPRFGIGLGTWWIANIFTMICCVGLINATNMADGKNGLVLGLSLGWLTILATRSPDALFPFILFLGATLSVLLLFNLRGLLFLGDGGAYGIATALGLLAIMIYNSPGPLTLRSIWAEELVVLFLVPVMDSFRLAYVRLRQGRSPMSADRDHLHHHLQDKFGWPAGLAIYLAVALLPGAVLILGTA